MSDTAIRVDHLVKTYRRSADGVRAVDDLSFTVKTGSIFGLLGPNGAGKTTTLRILTTLARPTSGRAEVLGFDVATSPLDVRRRIGVVIQEHAAELFLSVRDNLLTFARFHGLAGAAMRDRADEVMVTFGLDTEANRKVQDMSGGFRRRVQVAKMFMTDTPIIFLDEFSTGMDPILKRAVMALLRQHAARGRTIVLTTQILTEAEELCDDILIINKGRQIARGTLETLKTLVSRLSDVTLTFDRVPDRLREIVAPHRPVRMDVEHHTVRLTLREQEASVIDLVGELSRESRVLRVEIAGASLEDIFVELTQEKD